MGKGLELYILQPSPNICLEKGLLINLGWMQQVVTPAFVLVEYISSQESKRYL